MFARPIAAVAAVLAGVTLLPVGAAAAGDGGGVAGCRASDLKAKQTDAGAGMSQPWIIITLTNRSGHACRLHGYPVVTRIATSSGSKSFKIRNGNFTNMGGPGPSSFVVAPGKHAWFAVGTATAYDPPVVSFVSMSFAPSPGSAKSVSIDIQASRPTGKPFPVGVTAYAPGSPPAQP